VLARRRARYLPCTAAYSSIIGISGNSIAAMFYTLGAKNSIYLSGAYFLYLVGELIRPPRRFSTAPIILGEAISDP